MDPDLQLIEAAKNGQDLEVFRLLQDGADSLADEALRWAAVHNRLEVVKLLLDYGVDIHAHNDSALRAAAVNGHTELVKLLLERGANPHAKNDLALRLAAKFGHPEVVKLLLEYGATPSQEMISESENLEIKELLQAKMQELEWQALGTKSATKF